MDSWLRKSSVEATQTNFSDLADKNSLQFDLNTVKSEVHSQQHNYFQLYIIYEGDKVSKWLTSKVILPNFYW